LKKLIIYQIDSFTKEKFKGNPAGVILNADGLRDDQMQLIARELNNSETAFLFASGDSKYDGIIRYFTPLKEVPICGHATIAAMYAKALEENLESCLLYYKTQIGILPLKIKKEKENYKITMTQGKFSLNPPLNSHTVQKLLKALGICASDLDNKCPDQIASTGYSKVIIGIKSRKTLNKIAPDFIQLINLSNMINCDSYFVFTFDTNNKNILTYARMFAPAIGINEDPVTGSAYGPLGGYLIQNRLVAYKDNFYKFNGAQGEQINRFGIVEVVVNVENNNASKIVISGFANLVFRTEIEICVKNKKSL